MMQGLQQRPFIYVLGPNQDARLASVASGASIPEVLLQTEDDAPFVLTGRSVRHSYDHNLNQANLTGLKTRWTGPTRDYRIQGYLLESLQMVYYGQFGNPKPIVPGILYPPRSILMLDLINTGANAITNLSFYFWGFKLFPPASVPAYTYPTDKPIACQTFSYPVAISALGAGETRLNQFFTVKQDADFVFRAGQGITISSASRASTIAEVAIRFKDFAKNPYSSDFVPFDICFGTGDFPSVIPVGPNAQFVNPFGTGPSQPGLVYPEIYVPKNHQLIYDLQRSDNVSGATNNADLTFNLIGGKVFDDTRG